MHCLRLPICMLIGLLIAGGCRRDDASGPPNPASTTQAAVDGVGRKLTVCLLPKKKGLPYFTTCARGAEEAARELGITLIYGGTGSLNLSQIASKPSASTFPQFTGRYPQGCTVPSDPMNTYARPAMHP